MSYPLILTRLHCKTQIALSSVPLVEGRSNSEKSWQPDNYSRHSSFWKHTDFCSRGKKRRRKKKGYIGIRRGKAIRLSFQWNKERNRHLCEAAAVPPIGITCEQKDASNRLGLYWPALTEKNKTPVFDKKPCRWNASRGWRGESSRHEEWNP